MAAIGIDLGGTIVKVGLVEGGRILGHLAMPVDSGRGLAAALPTIEKAVDELLASNATAGREGRPAGSGGRLGEGSASACEPSEPTPSRAPSSLLEWPRREGGRPQANIASSPTGAGLSRVAWCRSAEGGNSAAFRPRLAGRPSQPAAPTAVQGVAMAFAGQVDVKGKRVLSTNKKYDDAQGLDLVAWARERWGCPFFIDNDARMAAVGEWQYGAGRGVDDLVTMTIGTGIGTAVINGGMLPRGGHSQFGCLGGHLTVRVGGRKCTCGNLGCVEAESGSWALPLIAREREGFANSALSREEKIDYAALFRLAGEGDDFSVRLRNHCMDVWGAAIVTYIHAYDPDMVILGGGVLRSAEVIVPYLQHHIDENAWTPRHRVTVRCAELGDASAILGAVHCLLNPELQ